MTGLFVLFVNVTEFPLNYIFFVADVLINQL